MINNPGLDALMESICRPSAFEIALNEWCEENRLWLEEMKQLEEEEANGPAQ